MGRYQLTWGASGVVDSQCRLFGQHGMNDAITRFAERVVELDQNPAVWAGWVHLKRLPSDGQPEAFIAGWTKTSDETPTAEGEVADPV